MDQRVALLQIQKALFERSGSIAPEDMEKFVELRLKDYPMLV